MSFRDRLVCFTDFVGLTLLAVFSLLSPSNCFLTFLRKFFAAVLKLSRLLTKSAIYGAANFSKSTTTRFAAGTIYLRKNGNAVLSKAFASAPKSRPRFRPLPL